MSYSGHAGRPIRRSARADEAKGGVLVGEDADYFGAPIDLAVEALDRVGRVQVGPMLRLEGHLSEHIGLGLVEEAGKLEQLGPELIGDLTPLRLRSFGIVQWAAGCRNGAELWRRLKARGFRGSLRVVAEWATRRRRAEKADAQNLHRIPSARTIARLMTIGRETLSKAATVTIAAIEAGVPTLVEACEIIAEFHLMIRRRAAAELSPWIERARASLVALFARGVAEDEAAVRAAITLPWSNGQR